MCDDCVGRRSRTRRQLLFPAPIDRWAAALPIAGGLSIYPRSAWADESRAPRGTATAETVQFYLVHHTAGSNDYDEDGAVNQMRSAYDLHTGPERGWNDVAYNFFIDRFGRVFEGRAGSVDGPVVADATAGSQGFAQLVCLLGNFMTEMPSDDALTALQRTLAWMSQRDGVALGPSATTTFASRGSNRWPVGEQVTTNTIAAHRDMSFTECPGDLFAPYVHDQLPAAAAAVREANTTTTTTATSTTTTLATTTTTIAVTTTPHTAATSLPTSSPSVATAATEDRSGGTSLIEGAGLGVGAVAVGGLGWVIARRMRSQ